MAQVWQRQQLRTSTPFWDDPPNTGEAEGRQSSGRDRGGPVVVGKLVNEPGIDETGTTLHHLENPPRKSRWPTGTGPEVAHPGLPAWRNPGEQ